MRDKQVCFIRREASSSCSYITQERSLQPCWLSSESYKSGGKESNPKGKMMRREICFKLRVLFGFREQKLPILCNKFKIEAAKVLAEVLDYNELKEV